MTCKDCMHYEVCIRRQNSISLDPMKSGYKCPEFKNKADFAEVRRGKWERPVLINGHWYRRCTSCLYDSAHGAYDNKEFTPAFCSNCGAKMEG